MSKNKIQKPIRQLVRSIYDLQEDRKRIGLRLVNHFMVKMGIAPSQKRGKARQLLDQLKQEYKRITDGLLEEPNVRKLLKEKGLITDEAEMVLVSMYFDLLKREEQQVKALEKVLEQEPIYTTFLKNIKGIGPLLSGVLISEIDITKAKYASSLFKYAGLDVVTYYDEKKKEWITEGRRMKKEHLEEREYIDKDGKKKVKKTLTFNPFLKSKLVGEKGIAHNFIMHRTEPYYSMYLNYKFRVRNKPEYKNESDGHIHNMAKRYIAKQFLVEYYKKARELAGLPVYNPYAEEKLGIKHAV